MLHFILQLEDDTAIIAGKLSYVPALNGNSLATATPLATTLSGSTATGTATGIVAQPGAADFFSFAAAAGTATISGQVSRAACSAACAACVLNGVWLLLRRC